MSTSRHIREARRITGWPIGHADPDREDDDAEECPALDDFDAFFAATQPAGLDGLAADEACAQYEAGLDARASQ